VADVSAWRVAALAALAGALVGGAVAGVVTAASASGSNGGTNSSPNGSDAATAPVARTDLSTTVQDGGSIGFSGSYTVAALTGRGVYTWLPQPGQVIREDRPVYSVNDEPVPLLYGSIPAWRAFDVGMSEGPDVGELTRDLIRLGFGAGLAQSDQYSDATATAVERWQARLGLPVTGRIALGGVVFEPGPIQVTSVAATPGMAVQGDSGGGTVLSATGTTPVVTVDLDVSQEYLVKPGDAVQVVLPDGTTTVGGRIQSVGSVATCPGSGDTGSGNAGAGQSPCSSIGSGTNSGPTVTVTITLDQTPAGAALDQAPVNVNITTQTADNVLAVPVNALLALQNGGYAVQVVSGKTSHLVRVATGLYGNNLVQVSGPGIVAGMRVEVPSS
jgi:HlyD family secretion protein